MKYQTMTVGGGHGSEFTADSDDEAIMKAEAAGYDVLDVQDSFDGPILVIAD